MKSFLHSLTIALGLTCIAIAPASSETIANSKQFGIAPPACERETQLYLNICASRWAKTADFLRSLIYDEVYSQIPESRQSQLKAVEKTWNSYRDAHCQELSAPFQKGSIYPLLYLSCRARVTNDRIADLQGTNFSQITSDVTTQRLAKILNHEKMKNSVGQRQWLQYQAQQCQFESLGFIETSRSAKQCRDRLAEGRLLELEAMLGTR
ncbi:lysozyme inhibitor LprI family protein [Pseudanabaena sp. BC1403]|uniref:lysozyme inhibitor LprI family protein n=1 Tax=Pseudanabaena sp. BC1403 TaxID=2043171 RepID=UPI000CD81FC1|nr:lysozyme inhibitor LprI family protein [Pseudanabaena sp. BC1403]